MLGVFLAVVNGLGLLELFTGNANVAYGLMTISLFSLGVGILAIDKCSVGSCSLNIPLVSIIIIAITGSVFFVVNKVFYTGSTVGLITHTAGMSGMIFMMLLPHTKKIFFIFFVLYLPGLVFFMPTSLWALFLCKLGLTLHDCNKNYPQKNKNKNRIRIASIFILINIIVLSIFFKQDIRQIVQLGGFEQIGTNQSKYCENIKGPLMRPCVHKKSGYDTAVTNLENFNISDKFWRLVDRVTLDQKFYTSDCLSEDIPFFAIRQCIQDEQGGHTSFTPGYRLEFLSKNGMDYIAIFCILVAIVLIEQRLNHNNNIAKIFSCAIAFHIIDFNNFIRDLIFGSIYLGLVCSVILLCATELVRKFQIKIGSRS